MKRQLFIKHHTFYKYDTTKALLIDDFLTKLFSFSFCRIHYFTFSNKMVKSEAVSLALDNSLIKDIFSKGTSVASNE